MRLSMIRRARTRASERRVGPPMPQAALRHIVEEVIVRANLLVYLYLHSRYPEVLILEGLA